MLTGDSQVSSLTCEAHIIDLNGFTLTVDGKEYKAGTASQGSKIEVKETKGDKGAPPEKPGGEKGEKPDGAPEGNLPEKPAGAPDGEPPAKPDGAPSGNPPEKPSGNPPAKSE